MSNNKSSSERVMSFFKMFSNMWSAPLIHGLTSCLSNSNKSRDSWRFGRIAEVISEPRTGADMACMSASRSSSSGKTTTMISSLLKPTQQHRSLTYCLFLVIYLTWLPVCAKQGSLKEVTDGNWEEILAGEWMIELWVIIIITLTCGGGGRKEKHIRSYS